jgi:3-methyladenine DNA glycosylase AlkD
MPPINTNQILKELESCKNPEAVKGMARFGINPKNTYGISMPVLRKMARGLGPSHQLAIELWTTEVHEARILASLIDLPNEVTVAQMQNWVEDFDSWDVCDQCCSNLFSRTQCAYEMASEWSSRKEEFVKRAGFALMASLAWHDKQASDSKFLKFLPAIKREATDERNFVRKAVNWALRQIGKRNARLRREAVWTAKEIHKMNSKSARWIASDALREFTTLSSRKAARGKGKRNRTRPSIAKRNVHPAEHD